VEISIKFVQERRWCSGNIEASHCLKTKPALASGSTPDRRMQWPRQSLGVHFCFSFLFLDAVSPSMNESEDHSCLSSLLRLSGAVVVIGDIAGRGVVPVSAFRWAKTVPRSGIRTFLVVRILWQGPEIQD
jgi:hypothetical protein